MIAWGAFFLALGLTASASPLVPEPAYSSVARGGSRIVSGWEAQDGQFPYQLSLRLVNSAGSMFACGASLVHSEWALTAAHCTAQRVRIIVSGGSNSFARPEFQVETTEYYTHPSYIDSLSALVQPNDISLVKFASVTFNDRVQPIRIASSADKDNNFRNVRLVASGWGSITTGGQVPDSLNWVYLRGISNADCLAAYALNPLIQDSTLCTIGYNQISQSTCHGDNGGPLVLNEDGVPTLVGVSSFMANLGCHVGIPAGFVRANYYLDWYTEVTGIDFEAEEATTVAPEEEDDSSSSESSSSESSESSSEESSEEETTEAPEEEVTEAPEEEVTEAPEEEVTEAPEEEATEAPEEEDESSEESSEVTEAPEEEVTEAPEEEVTEAPEEEVTEDPEEEVTEAPEEEVTEAPEEEETEAPEEEVTEAPEEEVTEAPEEEVTEDPEEEVTEAPEEEVTEAPEEEETEAPEEEVTEAPEEEVTEAPEEEVTEAPEEEVTEAPEEEATEAPEEEATEAPEEEVTEAPEEEEEGEEEESKDVISKMRRFFRFRA